jgi:hypothetical protein
MLFLPTISLVQSRRQKKKNHNRRKQGYDTTLVSPSEFDMAANETRWLNGQNNIIVLLKE